MVKPRTATKTHADRDGTVLNVETNLLIARKEIVEDIVDAKEKTRKKVALANDAFGKKFSGAVDKEHVDRRAANIAMNLASLEDEQLHVTLYHLFFYIKDLGLLDRAKKQEELFSAGEVGPAPKIKGEEDDEGDGDHDSSSASSRIGVAARKVAESAGAKMHGD